MAVDYSGAGDPARTLSLLWGLEPVPKKRGPKAALTIERVVTVAIEIADAEGLEALSMRRLAQDCGIATMSIYTYVPARAELIDLMLDAVARESLALAESEAEAAGAGGSAASAESWRWGVERVARETWATARRHPWLTQIATTRPVIGPGTTGLYERQLAPLDGIGLTDLEIDTTLALVLSHATATARAANDAALAEQRTGLTIDQWWEATAPALAGIPWADYPLASRVGQAAGEAYGAFEPDHGFAFGLERILDGIATLVDGRRPV